MKILPKAVLAAGILLLGTSPVLAAETSAAASTQAHYSTSASPLGDLLDNPAAKAVLEKHVPQLISNESIQQARSLTLKGLQTYAGDLLTDAILAAIDADLAKISAK